jgi:peroxiredoxin
MIRSTLFSSAVIASALMCQSALAQVQEDAKKVLSEAAQAFRAYEGVQFKAKRSATGMLAAIVDSETTVSIWRPKGSPMMVRVEGRTKQPGKGDKKQTFVFTPEKGSWLDWEKNTLVERLAGDQAFISEMTVARQTFLEEFSAEKPFERELGLANLRRGEAREVNGEVCDIIEGTNADNTRNFMWAISVKDRLPRQFVRGTGKEKILEETVDFTNVRTDMTFTAKDFEIAMPTGFVKDSQLTPPAAPGAAPTTPVAPAPAMESGLKAGTAAPAFSGTDTSGKNHSLSDFKGNAVVLTFWGPMFKQSVTSLAGLRGIAEEMKNQKVVFVGMACREMSPGSAEKVWKEQGMTFPLIAKADQVATDYKIAGFPSVVVIGADGNIVQTFAETPSADALKAAINGAMGK